MTDNPVLDALKESFADVRMGRPLETVVARGRDHRRRRRAATGGTLLLAAGLLAATAAGLHGSSDTSPPELAAAWSVATDPGGTITVELHRPNDMMDPSALQSALEAAHAPAIVRIGDCTWPSPGPGYRGGGISMVGPGGRRTIRITPSKLPKGALVVFAINGQLAPPGTTERTGFTAISVGVMAPGGTVTCE